MQGQGMAGERRPVYLAWIHWMGGDNGVMGGSNEAPRTGRGGLFGQMTFSGSVGHCGDSGQPSFSGTSVSS